VSTAANGEQTLELCERAAAAGAPFDAVILDVTVPGAMGGQETLQCLRERFPSISAVMSSGYGEEPWMAGERRPDAVLPKPYQVHELLACVRAVTR
jgi:DNA-binding response OmpR family regulator